jgi:L-galactose dehydrogenase
MEYRILGRTGLRISLAGIGTGGPSQMGQSTGHTANESARLVRVALDLGINVFDTAPQYRQSEALLGDALQGVPRGDYVVTTKFHATVQQDGRAVVKEDPADLTRSLEESLRRLRLDTVDVLQFHALSLANYDQVLGRFLPGAQRAQQAGKVRYIGVTESCERDPHHDMLVRALQENLFDTLMVKYGILNQAAEERVLPLAKQRNAGVLVMASVRTSLRTAEEALAHVQRFAAEGRLADIAATLDDPLALGEAGEAVPSLTRAAYQFAAQGEGVSTVLVGTGNADHLRANVADILGQPLSAAQMESLRRHFRRLAWTS